MEIDESTSSETGGRGFYLPAMPRVSTVPGRVERFLADLGPRRAAETPAVPAQRRVPGFYLPATLQLAASGRVGRAVAAVRRRGATYRAAIRARVPGRSKAR